MRHTATLPEEVVMFRAATGHVDGEDGAAKLAALIGDLLGDQPGGRA